MAGEASQDPLIGARVGPCRVESRLAAGGMGVVYRARHLQLNQDVAVKILAQYLANDQEYVTRFFREAGAAGQIDHPNVVRVVDVGKHEDRYYLVMEFVSGDTLDRILETERKLPLARATKLMREIAAGLAAAHRAGIIHRDVKPGNIIVSPDGRPHLTDFGLARHTEARKGLTIEGTFLGTPEYASPEQVEGRKLDHRTDLYSLGVTYYQLLSGTLPFLGESPMEIAIKRTKEDPRPLANAFPACDPRACAIVDRLIRPEPSQRYQNATDLIRDLDAILGGEMPAGVKAESTRVRSGLAEARRRRRIREFLHWDLFATALVLAFVSGGMAPRGEGLSGWIAAPGLAGRLGVLLAGVAASAAALALFTRDLVSRARRAIASGLALAALFLALTAGAWLARDEALGAAGAALATLRAAFEHAGEPPSRLALGLLLLASAAVISFEHQPGSLRVVASRVLCVGGLVLLYAFGVGTGSLQAPLRDLMATPEVSIPLLTGTALAAFFGILLLTGYDFETVGRSAGLFLVLMAAVGVVAFAALGLSGPGPRPTWTALLEAPFRGIGPGLRGSGSLMAAAVFALVVERGIVDIGFRHQERASGPRRR